MRLFANTRWLASADGLKGESQRAAAELTEARRLNLDDPFSSLARLQAVGYFGPRRSAPCTEQPI
jgi:hypothetical protein